MPGPNDVTKRVGRMARGADLAWVAEALVERREEILSRWRDVSSTQPFHSAAQPQPKSEAFLSP